MDFPIISVADIHTDFDRVSKQLFDAACKWGFFIITDHGITRVDEVAELLRTFFDLPLDVKTEKIVDESAVGYDGGKKFTSFAASEAMLFGGPAGSVITSNNLSPWWDEGKRKTIESFKAECYHLTITMMSGFAVCMGLDKDFFSGIHGQAKPGDALRLIKYPKLSSQPEQGKLPRLSTHTDWGSLTFVFTEQAGLEIQDPQNNWFHIPVIPNGIVVNIGDALSLWTNQALKSTLHRITWDNLPRDQERYSMAYFSQPNNTAQLKPIGTSTDADPAGASITYGDYWKVRYRLTYGAHSDCKTGKRILDDIDPAMAKLVHSIGVADAGALQSNDLVEV